MQHISNFYAHNFFGFMNEILFFFDTFSILSALSALSAPLLRNVAQPSLLLSSANRSLLSKLEEKEPALILKIETTN